MSDVLPGTSTYGHTSAGWPAKKVLSFKNWIHCIHQLCTVNIHSLGSVITDRAGWRERDSRKPALSLLLDHEDEDDDVEDDNKEEDDKMFPKQELWLKVSCPTIIVGDSKAPFTIVTTPSCRGGRHSFP